MAKSAKSTTPPAAASGTPPAVAGIVTRLPLKAAQAHNAAVALVAVGAPVVGAALARTARGTNMAKARVYGYANSANGGGVPQGALFLLVPGFTGVPRGVNAAQWATVQAHATGNLTVAQLRATHGVSGRTIRRAFRAGAVAFGQPSTL